MTPEEWARLADRAAKLIPRYLYVLQAVVGAVLLSVGYFMGHVHFRLIQQGARAPGTVVDFKYKDIGSRSVGSSTPDPAFMPIVEFQAGERVVRFQDWLGTASGGGRGRHVMVLYDPARPSDAMIDRPVWNWLPWAPIFGVGLFLTLVAIKGWFQSMRSG